MNKYSWNEVVMEYMENTKVPPMDEVIVLNASTDKQSEAVMAQLIAAERGLC